MAIPLIQRRPFAATVSLGVMLLLSVAACSPPASEVTTPVDNETAVMAPEADTAAEMETAVVTLALTAEGREFFLDGQGEGNPDMVVQQGDTVEVTLCVTGGTHDWVLDEFNAATARLSVGDECSTVEFVADQVGEFEYYCGVGNHRAEGMAGRFVVE
jgi:plastocyanin